MLSQELPGYAQQNVVFVACVGNGPVRYILYVLADPNLIYTRERKVQQRVIDEYKGGKSHTYHRVG